MNRRFTLEQLDSFPEMDRITILADLDKYLCSLSTHPEKCKRPTYYKPDVLRLSRIYEAGGMGAVKELVHETNEQRMVSLLARTKVNVIYLTSDHCVLLARECSERVVPRTAR